jgi:hypothetical protein
MASELAATLASSYSSAASLSSREPGFWVT